MENRYEMVTTVINYNGLILKASNPDPRIIKYYQEVLNKEIEIREGNIYVSTLPGKFSFSNIASISTFLQQITREDIKEIFNILNLNLRPNTKTKWQFYTEKHFFVLKVAERELIQLKEKVIALGLDKHFSHIKTQDTNQIYLVCSRQLEETFFDLITRLKEAFPQNKLDVHSAENPVDTYAALFQNLQVTSHNSTSANIPNAIVISKLHVLHAIGSFISSMSYDFENIIRAKLCSSEKKNETEVDEQQRLVLTELYKNILSGKCNKENLFVVNNHLSSFTLSEDLLIKIKLCLDIQNNSSLTPEDSFYQPIIKLIEIQTGQSIQSLPINYQDLRESFIKRLEDELKRFSLSNEELIEEMKREAENCSVM